METRMTQDREADAQSELDAAYALPCSNAAAELPF
jgi:hypothetical protein